MAIHTPRPRLLLATRRLHTWAAAPCARRAPAPPCGRGASSSALVLPSSTRLPAWLPTAPRLALSWLEPGRGRGFPRSNRFFCGAYYLLCASALFRPCALILFGSVPNCGYFLLQILKDVEWPDEFPFKPDDFSRFDE
jgi:hypothetical protein